MVLLDGTGAGVARVVGGGFGVGGGFSIKGCAGGSDLFDECGSGDGYGQGYLFCCGWD